jgi:hypothetical protein
MAVAPNTFKRTPKRVTTKAGGPEEVLILKSGAKIAVTKSELKTLTTNALTENTVNDVRKALGIEGKRNFLKGEGNKNIISFYDPGDDAGDPDGDSASADADAGTSGEDDAGSAMDMETQIAYFAGMPTSAPADDYGLLNALSSLAETAVSFMTTGVVNPDFDGKSMIGPNSNAPGVSFGLPGIGPFGPTVGVNTGGLTADPGLVANFAEDVVDKGLADTISSQTTDIGDKLSGLADEAGLDTTTGGLSTGGLSTGGLDDGVGDSGPYVPPVGAQQYASMSPPASYAKGGLVTAQGDNTMSKVEELLRIATDPSFDTVDPGVLQQGAPGNTSGPTMDYRMNPSYADGGVVSAGGPQQVAGLAPQGAQQQGPMPMPQMEAEMQRMAQNNPEKVMQMKKAIQQLMQAGEVTPQEINMAVQLATAAAQNPSLWPQLRQFAIQQGLADEQDLPQEYDQGLVFTILMAAKVVLSGQAGAASAPQSQSQPPQTTMRTGGEVPKSNNADGSVAINAHKGEYVIPEGVVLKKGTDFFDKMIGQDEKASA